MEKILFESAGSNLVGLLELPQKIPAPAVVLLHGLTNHKTDCPLINETSSALVKNGFIAFRFDFYGSGESPGEMGDKTIDILEQNVEDSIDFILSDKRVTKLGLWGRSLGGTFVCLLPTRDRIKARVCVSGASLFQKAFTESFERLKKKERELERKGQKLPGTGEYKGSFDFRKPWYKSLKGLDLRVTRNLENLDTILVLGTTPDQKVPLENACHIINNIGEPKKIWIFEGVDHDYKGVEKETVEMEIDWYKRWLL